MSTLPDMLLPGDPGAPAFREPWQAKAFAVVLLLHRSGHFAWPDWVETLAAEIKAVPQQPDEDADAAYHRQFLAALERIVADRGLTGTASLAVQKERWRRAYLNTPHGMPIDLATADREPGHDDHDVDGHDHGQHHHHHSLLPQRIPIAVSPAPGRRPA